MAGTGGGYLVFANKTGSPERLAHQTLLPQAETGRRETWRDGDQAFAYGHMA